MRGITKAQRFLIDDLKEYKFNHEYLWIECLPGERRTAKVLERLGLVEIGEDTTDKQFLARYLGE